MRSNTRVFRLLILFFSATLLLTSCGSVEKKEEVTYERLIPDQNISNITINGDANNFIQLFDYLLPGYKREDICKDEFNELYFSDEANTNTLYIIGKNCESINETDYIKTFFIYNGRHYTVVFFKTESINLGQGIYDKTCFFNDKKIIGDTYYGVGINAFSKEELRDPDTSLVFSKSEYCPDKKEFDNEYLQFTNLIYDSFLKIEK